MVWSVKTGELHVLAVALKCETLHALSVPVSGTQQCRASLCAVLSQTSSMRSVTRATSNVPCWWEGAAKEKMDTKGEVTNNMTLCILPCLFGEMFNVQTRERASRTPRSTQVLLIATRSRGSVSEVSLAVGVASGLLALPRTRLDNNRGFKL